jgi:hypothetical protein
MDGWLEVKFISNSLEMDRKKRARKTRGAFRPRGSGL